MFWQINLKWQERVLFGEKITIHQTYNNTPKNGGNMY